MAATESLFNEALEADYLETSVIQRYSFYGIPDKLRPTVWRHLIRCIAEAGEDKTVKKMNSLFSPRHRATEEEEEKQQPGQRRSEVLEEKRGERKEKDSNRRRNSTGRRLSILREERNLLQPEDRNREFFRDESGQREGGRKDESGQKTSVSAQDKKANGEREAMFIFHSGTEQATEEKVAKKGTGNALLSYTLLPEPEEGIGGPFISALRKEVTYFCSRRSLTLMKYSYCQLQALKHKLNECISLMMEQKGTDEFQPPVIKIMATLPTAERQRIKGLGVVHMLGVLCIGCDDALPSDIVDSLRVIVKAMDDYGFYSEDKFYGILNKFLMLFRSVCPQLCTHLEDNDIDNGAWASSWLQFLLSKELPLITALRLWDAYLATASRGFELHIFFCLAILKTHQDNLLRLDHSELKAFLRYLPPFDVDRITAQARYMYQLVDHSQFRSDRNQ